MLEGTPSCLILRDSTNKIAMMAKVKKSARLLKTNEFEMPKSKNAKLVSGLIGLRIVS